MKVHVKRCKCTIPLALPGTALLTSDVKSGGSLKRQVAQGIARYPEI